MQTSGSGAARHCPKCRVDFQVVRTTFAEIDLCTQCGGVFLDPGEGVAEHGADDASFLVADGRAVRVRRSELFCPATEHVATGMDVYAMGESGSTVEFEYCQRCHGVFLDKGEGAALDALDSRDAAGTLEIQGATGARFAAPGSEVDRQSIAIERTRAAGDRSFFKDFLFDCVRAVAVTADVALDSSTRQHRRRRFFGR